MLLCILLLMGLDHAKPTVFFVVLYFLLQIGHSTLPSLPPTRPTVVINPLKAARLFVKNCTELAENKRGPAQILMY